MKNIIIFLAVFFFLCLLSYCFIQHIERYEVKGKLIEKFTSQNRGGNFIYYHLIYRLDNGTIEDYRGDETEYYNSQIGEEASFGRQRWK